MSESENFIELVQTPGTLRDFVDQEMQLTGESHEGDECFKKFTSKVVSLNFK